MTTNLTNKTIDIILRFLKSSFFGVILVTLLIFIQHRFWLYSDIYKDIFNKIGSNGDAYYNLAIYLQNNTNLLQGKFYSMDGDHFTWWSNIIAITGHGWAPSIIFGLLKSLTGSSIASFNLLFFSNLFFTQLGIFFLIRYWTKNQWIAAVAALFVPLSQGWNTFYMAHIHASFYWWLPFFVLSIEKITNQNLNFKQLRFWLYTGLFCYTLYWYIFADWHSFVFGSVFLIPYFIYKITSLFRYYNKNRPSFFILLAGFGSFLTLAIPFVLKVLEGSKVFNATRDIGAVNGTNFNTERFLGVKYIFMPIISGIINRFPDFKYNPKLNQVLEVLSKSDSMYPDLLSITTFWILIIAFIPLSIYFVTNRSKFRSKLYFLMVTILLSFFIILGPYIKLGGNTINSSYLPHQLIHSIFYPLQAIRAVWRGAFVGYLAVIILWSLIFNFIWQRYTPNLSKVSKNIVIVTLICLLPITMIIQNNGFTVKALESYKQDIELNTLLDKATQKSQSYDFYIWRKSVPQDQFLADFYHYNISERNNQLRYQQVNWVMGGTAGTYPIETGLLDLTHSKKINIFDTAQILNKKEVALILQENDLTPDNQEYMKESGAVLSNNWSISGQTPKYTLWKKNQVQPIEKNLSLKYSINISGTQSTKSANNLSVNIENTLNDVWVNSGTVKAVNFEIKTYKAGQLFKSISKSFGEPAFLGRQQGLNYQWGNKEKLFDIGVDTFKLYREGVEVYSQNIKTLQNDDYLKLVEKNKQEKLSLDQSTNPSFKGDYGLSLTTVHIETKVIQGAIITNKKIGKPIISQYLFRPINSQEQFSGYGMPGYIGQPNCPTEENYLPGDTISLWCTQYGLQMSTAGLEIKTTLQYQKQ